MSVLKEFKAFALKGNVVDLAVAVVIGGAFGKIVTALVADLIMPLVGAVLPGNEWRNFTVSPLHLKLGDFIGAVVDFFLIATVLFVVVVKFMGAFQKKQPDTKSCPECLETIPFAARKCKACASVVTALLLALLATPARADDPKYEYRDPTAPPPAVDLVKPTVWKANLTLGLTYVGGNAQSIGVSGTGLVSVKHYNNEWTLNGGGAYVNAGTSKYGKGGPVTDQVTAAENWLVKARYDRYFFEKNTVFVSFQSQGDRPSGYIYRLEPQVGYARMLFKSVHQLFRGEIGYDYTFEHRLVQPTDAMGNTPPRDVQYHSGRLFIFYENKFSPYATFSEGLELLEAFNKLEGFRLNSLTSLSSTLYKNVALKVNFTLKYNNDPGLRPAPTGVDPVTLMPFVYAPEDAHFQKLDMQLDLVLAVTII